MQYGASQELHTALEQLTAHIEAHCTATSVPWLPAPTAPPGARGAGATEEGIGGGGGVEFMPPIINRLKFQKKANKKAKKPAKSKTPS